MNPLNQLTISVRQSDEFYRSTYYYYYYIAKLHTQYRNKKNGFYEKKNHS